MSHVTRSKVVVLSLETAEEAGKMLGLVRVNSTSPKWWGTWLADSIPPEGWTKEMIEKAFTSCEFVLTDPTQPGAYQVGVVKNPIGPGYMFIFDTWSSGYGLLDKIGQQGEKLNHAYSVRLAHRLAAAKGYEVFEQPQADGGTRILMRVPQR